MRNIARSTACLLGARVGTQVLLAVATIIVARGLGVAGLGRYALLVAGLAVANALTTFGTDMVLIREIAAGSGLARLRPALGIQLALAATCIGAAGIAAVLPLASRDAGRAVALASTALLPLALFTVCTTALRGAEQMVAYALLNVGVAGAQVVGLGIVVAAAGGIVGVAAALVAAQVVASGAAYALCRRRVPGFVAAAHLSRVAVPAVAPLVRASAPMAGLAVLGLAYARLALYETAALAGAGATGQLSAALRLVESGKGGHQAALTALYPRLARDARADARESNRQLAVAASANWRIPVNLRLPARFLLPAAVALAALISLAARPLVEGLYGTALAPAVAPTRILAWALVPYAASSLLVVSLLACRREAVVARALVAGVAVLGTLCLWLVPSAGATGAAWATLAAEGAQVAVLAAAIRPGRRAVLVQRAGGAP